MYPCDNWPESSAWTLGILQHLAIDFNSLQMPKRKGFIKYQWQYVAPRTGCQGLQALNHDDKPHLIYWDF